MTFRSAILALSLLGGVAAVAAPADAQRFDHHRPRHFRPHHRPFHPHRDFRGHGHRDHGRDHGHRR